MNTAPEMVLPSVTQKRFQVAPAQLIVSGCGEKSARPKRVMLAIECS